MEAPTLPGRLRYTPANEAANALDALIVRWSRKERSQESATGSTPGRLQLLTHLVESGPTAVGRLAHELDVSPPAITRMVDGLEDDGLVRRLPDPSDRRAVLVRATPAGQRWLDSSRAARVRELSMRLKRLSPAELATITRATGILAKLPQ
jgi:DNA-binding MarR family transcriptional regulator